MNKLRSFILLGSLAISTLSFAGGSVDIAVSDTSARIEHDATRIDTGAHLTVGGLINETRSSYLVSAGFNVVDQAQTSNEFIAGVGIKAFIFNTEETAFASGLGGFLRYQPDNLNGFGVETQLYYAPSILSFNGSEQMYELILRASYKVHNQARVFLGWTDVAAQFEDTFIPVERSVNLGFRLNY